MKPYLITLILPFFVSAQVSVTDSFADGNFTQNPAWTGDTAFFEVNSLLQLQLNDTAAGTRYLSTASSIAAEATWEFYARLDFNPSSGNYLKLYLMSDQQDLNAPLNGYFVRIGGSVDDRISLYRQAGTTTSLVAESSDDWVNTDPVEVRVHVERTAADLWILAADTSGGSNFQTLGSGVEGTHQFSTHTGLVPVYTKTRSDKFVFDDLFISGKALNDTAPPKLLSAKATSTTRLRLVFDEALDSLTARDVTRYELDQGIGKPVGINLTGNMQEVVLDFSSALLPNNLYRLAIIGVEDRFGNVFHNTVEILYYEAREGDLVFNELMVDPNPVVGVAPNALPDREYIELYNTTALPVSLTNFILSIGSGSYKLPDYTVAPGSFVVLTKDEAVSEFSGNLPVVGLDISSVALTNSGNSLSLLSYTGKVISAVNYTDAWYGSSNKADGGWSLEQIDPANRCSGQSNWTASVDPNGGTPGRANSVLGSNPDTSRPRMLRVSIDGDSSVAVHFSEALPASAVSADFFEVEPDPGLMLAELQLPKADVVLLRFSTPIDNGSLYSLWLEDTLRDCAGNPAFFDTLQFSIPQVPEPGELLINELLFNPAPGGSDFVEIYNTSDKTFDLSKLRIGNWDENLQQAVNVEELTDESFLIPPKTYLALTEDPAFLEEEYILKDPGKVVEVAGLPSLPDDQGSVVLLTSSLQVLEVFSYSEDMHLPMLDDKEGVSLERLSFDKAARDPDNWHSAAATAGFATPGYQNSQFFGGSPAAGFDLEPKVFSPNQDGYHDVLKILYSFAQPDNVVSISVYSSNGYSVKELQNQTSVGAEGFFTWDGTDENGQLMNSGIYIIVLDYFNTDGTREVLRKTCVLSL